MSKVLAFRNNKQYAVIETIYEEAKNNTVFYKALDINLDRIVGIKIIGYESGDKRTLINECKALIKAEAAADNIPSLYDYYDDFKEKKFVIVMQYIDGITLDKIIKDNEGRYEDFSVIKSNIRLLMQISRTLGQIHKVPYLQHKDLKPKNIIVKNYGDNNQSIYIIDFGISAQPTLKDTGTHLYQAPEQINGGISANYGRIDIFAMGLIAFEMLTGRNLRVGIDLTYTSKDIEWKSIADVRDYNNNISEEVSKVLKKCLKRQPDNRYKNGEELERAFYYSSRTKKEK